MGTFKSITFLFLLSIFISHSNAFHPKFKISNTFGNDDGENEPLPAAPPLDLVDHSDQQRVKPFHLDCRDIHTLPDDEEVPYEGPPVEEPPEEEPPPPPPKPPKRKPPSPQRRHGPKPKPRRRPSCWPKCFPRKQKKPPPHPDSLSSFELPTLSPSGQQEPILL